MTAQAARLLRSTVRGRSVLRSAAALEAGALLSLPLVAEPHLAAYADPLADLLAGPDLTVLGRALDARAAAPADAQRPRQASEGGARTPSSARPAPTTASTALPAPAARRPARAGLLGAGRAVARGATPAASAAPASAPAALGGAARAAGPPRAAAPAPGAPVQRLEGPALPARSVATSALRAAAGLGGPSPQGRRPGDGRDPAGAPSLPTAGAAPLAAPAPPRAGSVPVPVEHLPAPERPVPPGLGETADVPRSGGALADLLSRWEDATGQAVRAPLPGSPGSSDLPALAGGAPAVVVPLPGLPAAGGAVELVERVLDEVLRREVEQHALEGGRS